MPRGKAKQLTADELLKREQARREAAAELRELMNRWPELRGLGLKPEAIMATWFLFGDAMFEAKQ
jgi:hypothetical protein